MKNQLKAVHNFQSVSKAMWEAGIAAKEASDAFNNFAQTLTPWLEDDIDD